MKYLVILFTVILLFSPVSLLAQNTSLEKRTPYWVPQESGVNAGLRGLSAVSDKVAWASGSGGTVIRTIDGGKIWEDVSIPVVDKLDYRDIEAFDEHTAIVISAGLPAVIYKTTDGGRYWEQTYLSTSPGTFYDAMDFWNENEGIAFGDAIDGRLLILRTFDGGDNWEELPFEQRPVAIDGQGGFAASGTCLRTYGDSHVWIGLGGPESSVHYSTDKGETWKKSVAPINSGDAAGIFSIQFRDELNGIAIGGDYRGDSLSVGKKVAFTRDGGATWNNVMKTMEPNGYRSGMDFFEEFVFVVGRESADFYRQGERAYTPMEGKYYAVSTSKDGKAVYASGPRGAVAKIAFK